MDHIIRSYYDTSYITQERRETMFKINFEVRDSELDAQNIVNNSNYLVYLEHTRNKFLYSIGLDFLEMSKNNQNLLLVKLEIEFKKSLKPRNKFYVTCNITSQTGVRFFLNQEIRLIESDSLIARAINTIVCIDGDTKRLYTPEKIKLAVLGHSA
jgi:acyl-CoA thioester hydrolase